MWEQVYLCLLLRPYFSYWIALFSLNNGGRDWLDCNLVCQVWLIFLVGLLFSEGTQKSSDSGGDERWRDTGRCVDEEAVARMH